MSVSQRLTPRDGNMNPAGHATQASLTKIESTVNETIMHGTVGHTRDPYFYLTVDLCRLGERLPEL